VSDHEGAIQLSETYGHWGQHPDFPVSEWQWEVAGDLTRLGYWEWVVNQIDRTQDDA
jgi:hypothetical protein